MKCIVGRLGRGILGSLLFASVAFMAATPVAQAQSTLPSETSIPGDTDGLGRLFLPPPPLQSR